MNQKLTNLSRNRQHPIRSIAAMENQLRLQGAQARQDPSIQLRRRTLSALHDAVPEQASHDRWTPQRRAFAALALCACALAAAIFAFSVPQQSTLPLMPSSDVKAQAIAHSNEMPLKSDRPTTPSIAALMPSKISVNNPLIQEARLLVHDARQTLAAFQVAMPRAPRIRNGSIHDEIDSSRR